MPALSECVSRNPKPEALTVALGSWWLKLWHEPRRLWDTRVVRIIFFLPGFDMGSIRPGETATVRISCVNECVCVYIYIYVYMYICLYVYIYIHTHTHIYIYIYIYIYNTKNLTVNLNSKQP